ncbi:MAG: sodium-dependent bicarbonate transport family permease [Planctomycetota bacterium]
MDPIILFFLLGVVVGLCRSDLRLPPAVYEFLVVVLLLAIGMKGGVELADQSLLRILPQMAAVVALGFVLPLLAYPVLRSVGRLTRPDAASIAAHYGSVRVGTYAVAVGYLAYRSIDYESYAPLFVVLLEVPAILVGIMLARGRSAGVRWGRLLHEVLLGKSVVLLLGGLLIGWIAGREGIEALAPLFLDSFKGILALFLLEMGLLAATQAGTLRRHALFLLGFGVAMPLVAALIGAGLSLLLGLSLGGTVLLTTLSASASYIAVPAAMRLTVPEANQALSLAASLGVTFPFNVVVGIPIYHHLATWLHAAIGAV